MIDFAQLFTLSFWFNFTSPTLSDNFAQILFLLFAVCVIAGSVSRIIGRSKKEDRFLMKIYMRTGNTLVWMGIVGLCWFFLAFEQIPYFGARIWFALWLIGIIVCIIYLMRFIKVTIPQQKSEGAAKQETNKYLPKRSRK